MQFTRTKVGIAEESPKCVQYELVCVSAHEHSLCASNEAESLKTVFAPSVCARNEAPLINNVIVLHAVHECCGQRFSISRSVS